MTLYQDFIIKNMPKVLSQIDRDEHSPTYGSCDRNHWHLKIRDFTSAILQQSGLFLAITYGLDFPGNVFFHNQNIKKWAKATVYYWAKIQLKDGSFNEYYPWEHGFPPTAFSLYSACEIYRRLGMDDAWLEQKFRKTAKYLVSHIERQALNQELASITALYDAYLVLREPWILEGLREKLSIALGRQSKEGWFPEYEGADLGYLSVSLDMLAEYYYLSNDGSVLGPLTKTIDFIQYFIHPDETVGGEYGSRNTTYFLPCGLQTMANTGNATAEAILRHLYGNTTKWLYFLDSVDDRYFSHYLMHSFARALERREEGKQPQAAPLPFQYPHEACFKEAGLCSIRRGDYFVVLALKKGGAIKVFRDGHEAWLDCGYRVNYGSGAVSATNWQDNSCHATYGTGSYCVQGEFNKVKLKTSTPILHIGLRVVSFFFGNRIIGMLKKQIILVKKHDSIHYRRTVEFFDDRVQVTDEIDAEEEFCLERASNMSLRHVASGKFFSSSDLLCPASPATIREKKVKITMVYDIKEGKESFYYEKLQ